jgi:hypothetical protein
MSRCKLRTPWPIHFKLRIVIGIDSLMVCILFGEISIFHSRVMGKKIFTNIVWMLTTSISCTLGAVVYSVWNHSWWEQVIFDAVMMRSVLYWTNTLSWIVAVLDHWSNSLWVDMSLHSNTLSLFWANPSLLLHLNDVWLV